MTAEKKTDKKNFDFNLNLKQSIKDFHNSRRKSQYEILQQALKKYPQEAIRIHRENYIDK